MQVAPADLISNYRNPIHQSLSLNKPVWTVKMGMDGDQEVIINLLGINVSNFLPSLCMID